MLLCPIANRWSRFSHVSFFLRSQAHCSSSPRRSHLRLRPAATRPPHPFFPNSGGLRREGLWGRMAGQAVGQQQAGRFRGHCGGGGSRAKTGRGSWAPWSQKEGGREKRRPSRPQSSGETLVHRGWVVGSGEGEDEEEGTTAGKAGRGGVWGRWGDGGDENEEWAWERRGPGGWRWLRKMWILSQLCT
jgi:hypothetical protein